MKQHPNSKANPAGKPAPTQHLASLPGIVRAAAQSDTSKTPPIPYATKLRGEALKSKLKMFGGG